jgi:hypothetical protein
MRLCVASLVLPLVLALGCSESIAPAPNPDAGSRDNDSGITPW